MHMRLPLLLLLPVLLVGILLDWYMCHAVFRRCSIHRKMWRTVALASSVLFNLVLVLVVAWPKKSAGDGSLDVLMWVLYAYFSVYLSKVVWLLFDLVAKVPELWRGRRLRLLARCGWVGVAVFVFMWWGALVQRFRIEVKCVDIVRADLPPAFDGFTIAQFSDAHLGTYGRDTTFISNVVDSINALGADLIVFTGDIVNRRSTEMEPFVEVLARLDAPYGVLSVLGNHDYGDYYRWASPSEKVENMSLMYHFQQRARWRMLNNSTDLIVRGSDTIAVIGVENIGDPPFHVYGDLAMAYDGDLADDRFKILLSHNPAHWLRDIADAPDKNIALTLAGHTHAMQMEFFGWSPAAWRYPAWSGLYTPADSNNLLYVNIGVGEVAIPARLGGATPEVTLFTLRRQ